MAGIVDLESGNNFNHSKCCCTHSCRRVLSWFHLRGWTMGKLPQWKYSRGVYVFEYMTNGKLTDA